MDHPASFLADPPLSAEAAAEYEADVTGDGYVKTTLGSGAGGGSVVDDGGFRTDQYLRGQHLPQLLVLGPRYLGLRFPG
jgi:hypothetical protein